MWVHDTRLPHVLPPSAYHSQRQHDAEEGAFFADGWHFATTAQELRAGVVTRRTAWGRVTIERGRDGGLRAFVQAPARHTSRPARIATLGSLVFVSAASHGASLEEYLGARSHALGERLFDHAHALVVSAELDHPCNWKIPIENVLESYHVASLHDNVLARRPDLFKVFTGHRGGPDVAQHSLDERSTTYRDSLGGESAAYRALIRWIQPSASVDYLHHHAFPNVVFGRTSIVTFVSVTSPMSPTLSTSSIRLFLDVGAHAWISRVVRAPLAIASDRLIRLVMREDAAVYPDVQRGMEASSQPGVLGAREERIFHFHQFIERATARHL